MARTVLLADDSVTAQNMGRRILTDAGYEVITVNNGSAALKKVHEIRPDLIVLDVYMPGYGGLEVCQRLKESGETMRIPILLTVGKMEPFKADEAKRVRADGHLVKPFEASELLAALTRLEDRIVPQEPSRGKKAKDKKPSFWHDNGEAEAARDWTENVAYLADAKDRKTREEDAELPDPAVEVAKKKRVSDAPVPAAGELPVIADSVTTAAAVESDTPSTADVKAVTEAVAEGSAVATHEEEVSPSSSVAVTVSDIDSHEPSAVQNEGSAQASTMNERPRWVAQNIALSAEEAAIELEREMRLAESEVASPAKAEEVASSANAQSGPAPAGATFAAAAAASSASSGIVTATGSSPEESDSPQSPDTAAAWQNWQQIRNAVMSVQAAEAGTIVEKITQATQEFSASAATQPSIPESSPGEDAQQASDDNGNLEGAELANIVDTVLAELKPKLMEEIAKKLKK